MDLSSSIEFFGRKISGRFTIGSGIITVTADTCKRLAEEIPELGVITSKSIGPRIREGNREPVYAELVGEKVAGWTNAVGLAGPGCDKFAEELKELCLASKDLPENRFLPEDTFFLISIFGADTDDFVKTAAILATFADGLELNFSCPHAAGHGQAICSVPGLAADVLRQVKEVTKDKPLLPKLSPNLDAKTLKCLVISLLDAGADGFTATNTFGPVETVHSHAGVPILSNGKGGISGAIVKDEAVKIVRRIRNEIDNYLEERGDDREIPIVGMGGIATSRDCEDFYRAGATILGIGSALTGFDTQDLKEYFKRVARGEGVESLKKFVSMELKPFRLESTELMNPRLGIMRFSEELPCKAGQFVEVWIPGYGEKPFAPSCENPCTLAIGDVGILTNQLLQIESGATVYMRGPYGKPFSLPKNSSSSIFVLVGGGTGIAPLLLLAQQLRKAAPEDKIWVYLGGRSKDHLYFEKEFREFCDHVVCATNDGSYGHSGFVTEALKIDLARRTDAHARISFYNCGPEPMMNAAVKVEEAAGPFASLECSIERYMKCGVGICGVCSCDGLRTCVDGPVWNYDLVKASKMFGKVHRAKNTSLLDW